LRSRFSSLRLRIPVFAWESLNSSEPNKPKPPVVHPQVVTSYFQVKQATSRRFSREGNGKVRKRNGSSVDVQWVPVGHTLAALGGWVFRDMLPSREPENISPSNSKSRKLKKGSPKLPFG